MSKGGEVVEELAGLADALVGQKDFAGAEALLLSRQEEARREGWPGIELSVCSELMGFYRQRLNREGYYAARDRALALLSDMRPDPAAKATVLVNAATGMTAFGDAAGALEIYKEAEILYRRSLDGADHRMASLYNNMAFAFAGLGDRKQAERHIRMAMDVLRKLPHHPDMGTSWLNLAQLYYDGDPGDPRIGECLDAAMACFDDPETVWDGYYAHTARKCAPGFASMGRTEEAEDLEERAELIYAGT